MAPGRCGLCGVPVRNQLLTARTARKMLGRETTAISPRKAVFLIHLRLLYFSLSHRSFEQEFPPPPEPIRRGLIERLIFALGSFPVKVRRGLARGAWWSIYPSSAYWRHGGSEHDIDAVLQSYATRPKLVFWDVGAHYGIYSVGLAKRCGFKARIEAFEPDPVSQSRLRWHRRINQLSQIHIHPVTASDQTAEARIYQYGRLGSSTSHLPYPDETLDQVPSVAIQTVRLDDWVAEGRIAAPDLIKIDVEGHAFSALCGMRETLAQYLPVIVFAVHDLRERDQGGTLLRDLGYTLNPVSESAAQSIADRAFGEYLCMPPHSTKNSEKS